MFLATLTFILAVLGPVGAIAVAVAMLLLIVFIVMHMPAMANTDTLYVGQIQMGMEGKLVQYGHVGFTGTNATLTVPCKFRQIQCITYMWCGTPASDEVLSAPATADGKNISPAADGTITFTRTGAAKTAGLRFYYFIIGY